jgi:hypothetical protein
MASKAGFLAVKAHFLSDIVSENIYCLSRYINNFAISFVLMPFFTRLAPCISFGVRVEIFDFRFTKNSDMTF